MKRLILLPASVVLVGCATTIAPPLSRHAAEQRALQDLRVAEEASSHLGIPRERQVYNRASADLTMLLRSADRGAMWNRPLTLSSGDSIYRLHFLPGGDKGLWSPETFTAFKPAEAVSKKTIRRRNIQDGVGGALVGIRRKDPREPFAPLVGVTGAVTATLNFQGHDVALALHDPGEQAQARVAGAMRPLHADFSAPLAYYPAVNQTWLGLMGAMHVTDYVGRTGLYMLEPYERHRIPLIFVHGLISTPQLWRNVINELDMDPELRGRYQCWVFAYPTGNPYAYSALRFREELEKARKLYGFPRGMVIVGHSMGGLLAHMQAVSMTAADWERVVGKPAEVILKDVPAQGMIHRAVIFHANPDVRRIVFICTPHRGSDLATGWVGGIGMRLIRLPANVVAGIGKALGQEVVLVTGNRGLLPNGVTCLSPRNPTLKVMDNAPIRAPYYSIIGDRGRGDSPNSSDGVVAYWSSHLDGARSEKIVPGPHSSCELSQTIEELKRILKLHLKSAGVSKASPRG